MGKGVWRQDVIGQDFQAQDARCLFKIFPQPSSLISREYPFVGLPPPPKGRKELGEAGKGCEELRGVWKRIRIDMGRG